MVPMDAAAIVEANLLEFFRHFARCRKDGDIAELDGVSIASSGIEFHMFNAAFLSAPVAAAGGDLQRRIDLAVRRLAPPNLRLAFWACESKFSGFGRRKIRTTFERRGFHLAFRHPGMACESLFSPSRPLPALEFRTVSDRESRLAFSFINAAAFRLPFSWCTDLNDVEALWGGAFSGFLGYVDGEPVCTAATLIAADAVGLYAVATLPGHERRGYGEAITRYAVTCAQTASGLDHLILQATDPGLPLYRRIGYRVVTHFVIYTTPEPSLP